MIFFSLLYKKQIYYILYIKNVQIEYALFKDIARQKKKDYKNKNY